MIALIAIGLVLIASPAIAMPKKRAAKAAFVKGAKLYTKGQYTAAAAALAKSFKLEPDAETLFAWAQAERKLEHCDKAIELWSKLSDFTLPAENRLAVEQKIDECKDILAKQHPVVEPEPVKPPVVEPTPEPAKPPVVEPTPKQVKPVIEPRPEPEPVPVVIPPSPPQPERPGGRSRWKDPIGLSILGLGAVGLGVGGVFMFQARAADKDRAEAATYPEFIAARDRAESRGKIGVIGLAAGGAILVGGVVWIATRSTSTERVDLSAWVDDDGGGLVVAGGF